MERDDKVSRAELQLLIDDLRRLREQMNAELERRGVPAKPRDEEVLPETESIS